MYQVDGFLFATKEDARDAKREADGVAYIREQTDLRNPDVVLKLYNKLIDDEVFSTEVGIAFLRELQEHLVVTPYIKREEIRPIPVAKDLTLEREAERVHAREVTRKHKQKEWEQKNTNGSYRAKYRVALFFSCVFGAALIGIFALTYFGGKSVTIFNYENEIINRYEGWQNQLEQREQELNDREAELILREERLKANE